MCLAPIKIYQNWPKKEPLWNFTYALTPSPIKLKIHWGIEDTLPLFFDWTFLGWSVCWEGFKGQCSPGSFDIFEKSVRPWRATPARHEDHVTKIGLHNYWYMSPLLKTILTLPLPPGVGQIRIFHRGKHVCSKNPTFTRECVWRPSKYTKIDQKRSLCETSRTP